MKRTTLLLLSVVLPGSVLAGGSLLETQDQQRMRQDAERYDQYKAHGNSEPLGGYRETLGDPYYGNGRGNQDSYGTSGPTWEDKGGNHR